MTSLTRADLSHVLGGVGLSTPAVKLTLSAAQALKERLLLMRKERLRYDMERHPVTGFEYSVSPPHD